MTDDVRIPASDEDWAHVDAGGVLLAADFAEFVSIWVPSVEVLCGEVPGPSIRLVFFRGP